MEYIFIYGKKTMEWRIQKEKENYVQRNSVLERF